MSMRNLFSKLVGRNLPAGNSDYNEPLREFDGGFINRQELVTPSSVILAHHNAANAALTATFREAADIRYVTGGATTQNILTCDGKTDPGSRHPKINEASTASFDFATNSTTVADSGTANTAGKGALVLVPGTRIRSGLGQTFTVKSYSDKDTFVIDRRPLDAESDANVYIADPVLRRFFKSDIGRKISGQGIDSDTYVQDVSDDGLTVILSRLTSGAVAGFVKLSRVHYVTELDFGYDDFINWAASGGAGSFTLTHSDTSADVVLASFTVGNGGTAATSSAEYSKRIEFRHPLKLDFPGATFKINGTTSASTDIMGHVTVYGYTLEK